MPFSREGEEAVTGFPCPGEPAEAASGAKGTAAPEAGRSAERGRLQGSGGPKGRGEPPAMGQVKRAAAGPASAAPGPDAPRSFLHQRPGHDDLVRTEPAHIVHAWLGNSKEVAEDHYLMVTDEDFERASKGTAGFGEEVASRSRSPAQKKSGPLIGD